MAKVQFVNEVKYNGTRYPAHTVFMAADEDLPSLKQSGAIVIEDAMPLETATVPAVEPPVTPPSEEKEEVKIPEEDKPAAPEIDKMTVVELKALAKEMDIDIKGVEKKAELIAIIADAV